MTPSRSIYAYTANRLDGTPVSLNTFKGRVLLIVNTASRCGFTPQYRELEQLYQQYHTRGLEVLGFPCNQFGRQEPGSSTDIGSFCERNYGVSFPMFEKIDVNGPDAHPLYAHLKGAARGVLGTSSIKWNFTKFLVDREGNIVRRYAPLTNPAHISKDIESLLAV